MEKFLLSDTSRGNEKRWEHVKEHVRTEGVKKIPFWSNKKKLAWLATTFFLLLLAFLHLRIPFWRGRTLLFATLYSVPLYGFLQWPFFYAKSFWVNTYEEGRRVWSYVHWEFSPTSAVLDELRFGMMLLIVSFICEAARKYHLAIVSFLSERFDGKAVAQILAKEDSPKEIRKMAGQLSNWVCQRIEAWYLHSFLLAGAFLPYTYFSWVYIQDLGDQRFNYTAMIVHLIWGAVWAYLYLPLHLSLKVWTRFKFDLLSAPESEALDSASLKEMLSGLEPINNSGLMVARIASVGTLLFPALKAMF